MDVYRNMIYFQSDVELTISYSVKLIQEFCRSWIFFMVETYTVYIVHCASCTNSQLGHDNNMHEYLEFLASQIGVFFTSLVCLYGA